jgi:Protein of unknown function (DUF1552)
MRHRLSRRRFLRAAGVCLALPFLDAARGAGATPAVKRRMVAVNLGLGFLPQNFIPPTAGPGYQLTKYLQVIQDFRNQFTVVSGTSHPNVDGGHHAERSFLTAAPHPGSPSFKNSISVDQVAAEKIGLQTRFASLALTTGSLGLSWSRSGMEVPAIAKPSVVFARMFLEGGPADKAAARQWLRQGRSILDLTLDGAHTMRGNLGPRDREALDQYLTAVRETEQRLHKGEEWELKPKPKTDAKPPTDIENLADVIGRTRLLYDMIHLALQSDSTRIVTLSQPLSAPAPPVAGVSEGYHNLSHHGRDPGKIGQLALIEMEQMKAFRDFLAKLHATADGPETLLDQTAVILGSNLGNASSHSNENLPILLAGGGFKHGQHLAFDPARNYPLPNLFVSVLQRLGVEASRFASSTGTMRGLELA